MEKAIEATRDALVHALLDKDWCSAKRIGRALEELVNMGQVGGIERGPDIRPETAKRTI